MSIERIKSVYKYHHTAYARGYVSRKSIRALIRYKAVPFSSILSVVNSNFFITIFSIQKYFLPLRAGIPLITLNGSEAC